MDADFVLSLLFSRSFRGLIGWTLIRLGVPGGVTKYELESSC